MAPTPADPHFYSSSTLRRPFPFFPRLPWLFPGSVIKNSSLFVSTFPRRTPVVMISFEKISSRCFRVDLDEDHRPRKWQLYEWCCRIRLVVSLELKQLQHIWQFPSSLSAQFLNLSKRSAWPGSSCFLKASGAAPLSCLPLLNWYPIGSPVQNP